jgi:hypothetical protein
MKTAAGSGHKRGDLPPPGPVLHKLGPDFQLLAVEDHVGLITQGKPEVGVIKEVHFFEQSGGRTKIPTSETGTVHYYVHVLGLERRRGCNTLLSAFSIAAHTRRNRH